MTTSERDSAAADILDGVPSPEAAAAGCPFHAPAGASAPIDPAAKAAARERRTAEANARGTMQFAVLLSAVRCLLTYVMLPAIGAVGWVTSLARPIGLALHAVAIVSVWFSTRRMFRANSSWRYPYAALAVVLTGLGIAAAFGVGV